VEGEEEALYCFSIVAGEQANILTIDLDNNGSRIERLNAFCHKKNHFLVG
jgi:hypothetical protein